MKTLLTICLALTLFGCDQKHLLLMPIKTVFGQTYYVRKTEVRRVGPDFANPAYGQVWLDGGQMLQIPFDSIDKVAKETNTQ